MSPTTSNSDLLAKRNPFCMSTFNCHPRLFSSSQYHLGHLMERSPQPLNNLSVQHPIKIRFTFPPCRSETFSFVPIFATVPTIQRFGLSRLWMSIHILVPSQGSLKTPRILFQACGGTRLALIFSPWEMVFWMGWVNCPLQFTGLFRKCRKD